jgi:hypothetical protein
MQDYTLCTVPSNTCHVWTRLLCAKLCIRYNHFLVMYVWNGITAVLLTSWAKTTAAVKGFLRKQVEEVA